MKEMSALGHIQGAGMYRTGAGGWWTAPASQVCLLDFFHSRYIFLSKFYSVMDYYFLSHL